MIDYNVPGNCECDACEKDIDKIAMMTLIDKEYTYYLCFNCIILFVGRCLSPELWKNLIKKFPDSFYLHDDFYDGEGNAVQSAFNNHLLLSEDTNKERE